MAGRLQYARAFLRDPRSPNWGLAGQGLRFVIAGGLVGVVYVTTTTLLHDALAVPFQLALAIGSVGSVLLHFTLQRLFVWTHHETFALAMRHQALLYVLLWGSQYGLTALSTSRLPGLLGLPVELVYVGTVLVIAVFNFAFFRGRVFHPSRDGMSE
jgi:putative flippase GtrA